MINMIIMIVIIIHHTLSDIIGGEILMFGIHIITIHIIGIIIPTIIVGTIFIVITIIGIIGMIGTDGIVELQPHIQMKRKVEEMLIEEGD